MDNQMDNLTDNQNKGPRLHRRPLERMSYSNKGRFFKLRNLLNFLFILLCIIGMAVYLFVGTSYGGILLITAVIIKIFECVLRIMDK